MEIQKVRVGPTTTVQYLHNKQKYIVKSKKLISFFENLTAVDFYLQTDKGEQWLVSDLVDIRFEPTDKKKLLKEHVRLVM